MSAGQGWQGRPATLRIVLACVLPPTYVFSRRLAAITSAMGRFALSCGRCPPRCQGRVPNRREGGGSRVIRLSLPDLILDGLTSHRKRELERKLGIGVCVGKTTPLNREPSSPMGTRTRLLGSPFAEPKEDVVCSFSVRMSTGQRFAGLGCLEKLPPEGRRLLAARHPILTLGRYNLKLRPHFAHLRSLKDMTNTSDLRQVI